MTTLPAHTRETPRRPAILVVLAVTTCLVGTGAWAGEVLKFGAASPILNTVQAAKGAQQKPVAADVDIDLDKADRKDVKRAVDAVAARLENCDLVTIDLKTAKVDKELKLVARAARAREIPFVLENSSSPAMAELFGVGFDADAVVVKSRGNRYHFTIINQDPEKGVREAKAGEVDLKESEPAVLSAADAEAHRSEVERTLKEKGLKEPPPGRREDGEKPTAARGPAKAKRSAGEVGQMVDEALAAKPSFGIQTRDITTGIESWQYWASIMGTGYPAYASSETPAGTAVRQNYELQVELIATSYPRKKYVRFVTRGGGVTPYRDYYFNAPGMDYDAWWAKGYFNLQTVVRVEPNATYKPTGWVFSSSSKIKLIDWAPKTVNGSTTFSQTSGISYSAGPEVGTGGVGVSAGMEYSSSETISYETRDFNTESSQVGALGQGVQWTDENTWWRNPWESRGFCKGSQLRAMSSLGKSSFSPQRYAVWEVALNPGEDFRDYVQFTTDATATWRLAWINYFSYDWLGCVTSTHATSNDKTIVQQMGVCVNFAQVSPD